MVNVAIIDPMTLVRVGLAATIREDPELAVVADAGDLDDLLAGAPGARVDLAICDVVTPRRSGLGIVRELRARAPDCKILLLSVLADASVIGAMLGAGADGYALKMQPLEEIVGAIRSVLRGERYVPPSVSGSAVTAAVHEQRTCHYDRLTPREREVFELAARGFANAEIAAMLFISPRTAETHRHRIVKKLGAASMSEAIRLVAAHRAVATVSPP
jgi:DNA-binding NarL/FixJ family response regulator